MWSAPFLSRYSSTPAALGRKQRSEEPVRSAALCPMARGELPHAATQGKRTRTRSCSDFHRLPTVWTVLAREQSSRQCSRVAVSPGVGYSVEFSALLFLLDMFVLSLPSDATHLLFCPLHFLAQ